MSIISKWDPTKDYEKLDLVDFFDSIYIAVIPNTGVLPLEMIQDDMFNNTEFILELLDKYKISKCNNMSNTWIRVR